MEADDAFRAWTSGSLNDMVGALEKKTNLIDRQFLEPFGVIRSLKPSLSNRFYSFSLGLADLISLSDRRVVTFAIMGTPISSSLRSVPNGIPKDQRS